MRRTTFKKSLSSFRLLLVVWSLSVWTTPGVSAYPTGAGGCSGGKPAVEGAHLSLGPTAVSGTLMQAPQGLQLTLNGVPLGGKPVSFPAGEPQTLQLTSATSGFKGFLLRLSGVADDTSTPVDVSTSFVNFANNTLNNGNVQHASACDETPNIDGITHTNKDQKFLVDTKLMVDEPTMLTLDVTVVMRNSALASEFYYSSFVLNAVPRADPSAPVAAVPTTPFPTRSPSTAPTRMPNTMAPSIEKLGDTTSSRPQSTPQQASSGDSGGMESVLEEDLGEAMANSNTSQGSSGWWTTATIKTVTLIIGGVLALVVW